MEWAAVPDTTDATYAFQFTYTGGPTAQFFSPAGGTQWRLRIDAGGGQGVINDDDADSYKGVPRLIHCVYDGANVFIYKDGIEAVSGALTGTIDQDAGSSPINRLGTQFDGTEAFEGHIYFLSVSDNAFTPGQVAVHARDFFGPFSMADEVGVISVPAVGDPSADTLAFMPGQHQPVFEPPTAIGY